MKKSWKRLISALLSVVMVIAIALPAAAYDFAKDNSTAKSLEWEKISNGIFADALKRKGLTLPESEPEFADNDVVRVSIVLNAPSTIERGFTTEKIAQNAEAMQYRNSLKAEQDKMAAAISKKALGGEELDVVWNLTLAANIISANVPYGKISAIKSVLGVKDVVIEARYDPEVAEVSDDPQMSIASGMVGSSYAWAAGYTGAGSKVAIIDTGLDTDHQSFSSEAFDYAIAEVEEQTGKAVDLLTKEEVAAVLDQLNIMERYEGISADDLYLGTKVPFAFNYVDNNLKVTHDDDSQGEHGSHVAGIAAANRYIKTEDGFEDALEYVKTQGEAPDAQIIVMKVFGVGGGAYDSDYMVAIEDAIMLGCDSVNLSLGSQTMGFSVPGEYQYIMDEITSSSTVVTMSAGNSYHWANFTMLGYLYGDDVSFSRNGSPSSYTNSLAVASVDNDGTTGPYLTVADAMIFYSESATYGNVPIATIGGQEYDYIYIDSVGEAEEFAALADVLEGKIAICNRGEISFYVKANNAAANGAIATIIANNQAGVINMNLTGYEYTAPAVLITQADADFIKANSEYVETEEISYYTGKIFVGNTVSAVAYDSYFYTMSDFSSWGVPGSLELKPEITAPGGNIYSVNGLPKETDQYESMSGTSMAAPQIAGLAAVFAQYLRETGLTEKTGLTVRQLTNSLLMSTAEPLFEEDSYEYYSILKQGSGLARIDQAIAAKTYILMDESATVTAKDGKIKAELGETDGKFSVKFTVNNFTDEDIDTYIDATFFTQDIFSYYVIDANGNEVEDENGDYYITQYMDTWTTPLPFEIKWKIDGEEITFAYDENLVALYDIDGDEWFDKYDAIALLAFITGEAEAPDNVELADVNGDGEINTADVYELLKALSEATATVPANGSIEVEATVELDTEYFDENLTISGNYVEGYIHVIEDLEEEVGVAHSIPVLGFYGNWSEPSMFDKGSMIEYYYGEEYRTPYMTYALGEDAKNIQTFVAYSEDYEGLFAFGGNPLIEDDEYRSERNATSNGYRITGVEYTLIRNSAAKRLRVYADGEPIYEEISGPSYAAYYHTNEEQWYNTYNLLDFNFAVDGLPDGTVLTYELTMVPEYYVDAEGNVDWDALGKGATMSVNAVVDNTAPEVEDFSIGYVKSENAFGLTIKAQDNQYVAGAEVYAFVDGEAVRLGYAGSAEDAEAGDEYEVFIPLDLYSVDEETGKMYLEYPYLFVQIQDYALNGTAYKINLNTYELANPELELLADEDITIIGNGTAQITYLPMPWGIEDEEGFKVTFESSDETVAVVDENGLVTSVASDDAEAVITITAALGENSCTAECKVTVVFLDNTLNGVIWDENGYVWFSEFGIMDLPNYTKLTEERAAAAICATAIDADGTMYGATLLEDASDLYIINDDYSLEYIASPSLPLYDMTAAPALGEGMLLSVYGYYILVVDVAEGDYVNYFDLSNFTNGKNIVGIAYEERYDSAYGVSDWVLFVDEVGNMYETGFLNYNGSVQRFGVTKVGYFGYTTDTDYYNSLYFDGENIYWSKFNSAKSNSELIMCYNIYESGDIVNLGSFEQDVWPIGGLYEEGFSLQMYYYGEEEPEETPDRHAGAKLEAAAVKGEIDMAAVSAATPAADVEEAAEAETSVTKELVSDKDINNGLIVIDYDPDVVTIELNSDLGLISANEIEDGHILIAFADGSVIPAGTVLATVTADLAEGAEGSVVYIAYKDGMATVGFDTMILGEATPEEQTAVTVTDVTWTWSDDRTEATATLEIEGGDPVILDAEIVSKSTATCELDGYACYTALVRFEDTIYADTFVEEAPAHGHKHSIVEWGWEDDLSAAYLWLICEYANFEDGCNIVFTAEPEVVEHEPTCETDGYTEYIAYVNIMDYADAALTEAEYYLNVYGSIAGYEYFMEVYQSYIDLIDELGRSEFTDIVTVEGEKGGHVYEVEWTWADDYSAASATFACTRCEDEHTVEATVTSDFIDGAYVYVATVEFEGETYTDTVTVAIAGDDNGDGVLDGKDMIRLRKYLATYDPDAEEQETEVFPGADVNNDGVINGKDLIALRKLLVAQE